MNFYRQPYQVIKLKDHELIVIDNSNFAICNLCKVKFKEDEFGWINDKWIKIHYDSDVPNELVKQVREDKLQWCKDAPGYFNEYLNGF